ncbi:MULTISPECIES: hypothetical protein [Pseudomonadaceae]|uniref:hypothetical protein n=1 Tax=Pseudomonadaceae TaxID=135621 RepID=UPI000628D498|nr:MULTISPECIES: hypothetical protein [Pseudomonadaceae]KKJ98859.1 hypothetical protein PK34_02530 [Stutzerimonas stutzeri]
MISNTLSNGLLACEEAFERLKAGQPHVESHVGLVQNKITAGIVSVEAGFDRGYLKKARISHRNLIARIEAFRNEKIPSSNSQALRMRRALDRAGRATSELEQAQERLYQVLLQNIQLVERVRALEEELSVFKVKDKLTKI